MQISETAEESPGPASHFKREVGLWMATALVSGNTVGSDLTPRRSRGVTC